MSKEEKGKATEKVGKMLNVNRQYVSDIKKLKQIKPEIIAVHIAEGNIFLIFSSLSSPLYLATNADTASIIPMPTIATKKYIEFAEPAVAILSCPNLPTNKISVKPIKIVPSCPKMIGQANEKVLVIYLMLNKSIL